LGSCGGRGAGRPGPVRRETVPRLRSCRLRSTPVLAGNGSRSPVGQPAAQEQIGGRTPFPSRTLVDWRWLKWAGRLGPTIHVSPNQEADLSIYIELSMVDNYGYPRCASQSRPPLGGGGRRSGGGGVPLDPAVAYARSATEKRSGGAWWPTTSLSPTPGAQATERGQRAGRRRRRGEATARP